MTHTRTEDKILDKYVELLCRQNPKIELDCGNPKCKNKIIFRTKDVVSSKIFKFICPKCKMETSYDSSQFVNDFRKKMKKSGITVK